MTNIWWECEARATELYLKMYLKILYMEFLETKQKTLYIIISYNNMILLKIMNCISIKQRLVPTQNTIR